MGRADFYKKGSWLAICDVCGMKYHSDQMKLRWDGVMCCYQDWNIRQPQDFVRGIPDPQAVPWSRPDVQPQFVNNPVTDAITDFYGEFLIDFTNDIMVAFPASVLPQGVFGAVDNAQLGGELQIQDMQVEEPYLYVTPGSRLDNQDVAGFDLNQSELF